MIKQFIKNRKGQKVCVLVEGVENKSGLAFVMHGLGGFKGQPHIKAAAEAFLENGYITVRFDTTNTFGESDGKYEDATTTNYYEDLEDVIEWSGTQNWYKEPFIVCGHSLGGISTALYAQKHPEKVKALIPISPVVSGKLSTETEHFKEIRAEWERTGWREEESVSLPGVIKRLPWSHVVDRLKYDLIPLAGKLTMPVLIIVGDKDTTTPLAHQKILFKALPGEKEIAVIKGATHSFRKEIDISQLKNAISDWLRKLDAGKSL
ncbi:alpha/beta hydrolase [Candidatus Giovannonibacteria bacterium]|nr:alpha/beta hydrolase [Candidatus Giovannonibacteria bacterium]